MARRRNRSREKKKSRKDDNDDKPSAKAKSKAKKENKIQKLTQSMEDAQKGMLAMATELRELRGLPRAIQKQFEEQQEKREGKEKANSEPLLTMTQWKELLVTNKKATSLPPTPVKAGLFTEVCAKVKATPRHILQLASPTPAASTTTTPSVSTTRVEVIAALKLNLTTADNYSKFSLPSGYTVPVDAERELLNKLH